MKLGADRSICSIITFHVPLPFWPLRPQLFLEGLVQLFNYLEHEWHEMNLQSLSSLEVVKAAGIIPHSTTGLIMFHIRSIGCRDDGLTCHSWKKADRVESTSTTGQNREERHVPKPLNPNCNCEGKHWTVCGSSAIIRCLESVPINLWDY